MLHNPVPKGQIASYYVSAIFAIFAGNIFVYTLVILSGKVSGSDSITGWMFFTYLIPSFFLSFYAGAVADRRSRRTILIIYNFVHTATSIFCAAALSFDASAEYAKYWLFAVAAINGIALSFALPARFAILADILNAKHLDKGSIAINAIMILSFTAAPITVGGILQISSDATPFILLACLFGLSAALLSTVGVAEPTKRPGHSIGAEIREGVRYVVDSKTIKFFFLLTFLSFVLLGPSQVLLPRFAKTILKLDELNRGFFMSNLGIGLLGGALSALLLIRWRFRRVFATGCLFVLGCVFYGISPVQDATLAAALLGTTGFLGGLIANLVLSDLQMTVPGGHRGKVMGMYSLITQTSPAIGAAGFGVVAGKFGLLNAVKTAGFWGMAASLIVFLLSLNYIKTLE